MLSPRHVLVISALFAGLLAGCGGGEVGDTPVSRCYPEGQCDEAMFKKGVTAALGNATSGKAIYMARCATCHGEDGKGKPPETIRIDFTSVLWHARFRDGEIGEAITTGKPPRMPPQQMGSSELRDVVAFLRSLKPKPQKAAPKTGY